VGWFLAVAVTGLVLQVLPWFSQVNSEIIAFALPPNLALGWAVARISKSVE